MTNPIPPNSLKRRLSSPDCKEEPRPAPQPPARPATPQDLAETAEMRRKSGSSTNAVLLHSAFAATRENESQGKKIVSHPPSWDGKLPEELSAELDAFMQSPTLEGLKRLDALPGPPRIGPPLSEWLDAYIDGCQSIGEPIDRADIEALHHFKDAMIKTQEIMKWGAGNEKAAVKQTGGFSSFRAIAGKELKWALSKWDVLKDKEDKRVVKDKLDEAAILPIAQAGYCAEYSKLLRAEMLPYLQSGHTLELRWDFLPSGVHEWVVWHRPTRPPLIGDVWGYGPPHLAHHSNLPEGRDCFRVEYEQAGKDLKKYRAKQQEIAANAKDRFASILIDKVKKMNGKLGAGLIETHMPPLPLISPAFADRVAAERRRKADMDDKNSPSEGFQLVDNLSWVPPEE